MLFFSITSPRLTPLKRRGIFFVCLIVHSVLTFKTWKENIMSKSKAEIEADVKRYENEIEDLKAKYGTGVRPAWVGEEIGILYAQIERVKENENC